MEDDVDTMVQAGGREERKRANKGERADYQLMDSLSDLLRARARATRAGLTARRGRVCASVCAPASSTDLFTGHGLTCSTKRNRDAPPKAANAARRMVMVMEEELTPVPVPPGPPA